MDVDFFSETKCTSVDLVSETICTTLRTNEPTNQRTNEPTNQPTNQRTNQPTNQLNIFQADEAVAQCGDGSLGAVGDRQAGEDAAGIVSYCSRG
ncbi:MAG: PT domain-containing protein, partial [Spirochaetia bacterium]|nr:PT domain-containing protein [Spirochaetia bacterium]